MINYQQPDFYKFSEDSILLARYVISQLKAAHPNSILDVGAGCGVVGLEIIKEGRINSKLYSLEYQKDFLAPLKQNLEQNIIDSRFEIIHSSIGQYKTEIKFDCIVCNPPYFNSGEGRKSPSESKQVARTLEIDSLETFILKMIALKASGGAIYVVFPAGKNSLESLFTKYDFERVELTKSLSLYKLT